MKSRQQKPVSLGFGKPAWSLCRHAQSDDIEESEYEIPTRLHDPLTEISRIADQLAEGLQELRAVVGDLEEELLSDTEHMNCEEMTAFVESIREATEQAQELIMDAQRMAWSMNAPVVLNDARWFDSIKGLRAYEPRH
ncbi:hypothetical protein ACFL34_03375 [Candidatus Sumerlaeota bacterium]